MRIPFAPRTGTKDFDNFMEELVEGLNRRSRNFEVETLRVINFAQIGQLNTDGTNNVTGNVIDRGEWSTETANFNAVSGGKYAVDTTSTAITMTLPASPSVGDIVFWLDLANNFSTNNLTVGRNSEKIMGTAEDMTCENDYEGGALKYTGSSYGWMLI